MQGKKRINSIKNQTQVLRTICFRRRSLESNNL